MALMIGTRMSMEEITPFAVALARSVVTRVRKFGSPPWTSAARAGMALQAQPFGGSSQV